MLDAIRSHWITVLAVATLLGLSACGDDAEALSKPEFIEQANAICESTNAEMDALGDELWGSFEDADFDDPAVQDAFLTQLAGMMDEFGPIVDRQLAGLRALNPPAEDRELIATLLDDVEMAVEEFTTEVQAAAAGDVDARDFLESDVDPFAEVDARARAYGLSACGESD